MRLSARRVKKPLESWEGEGSYVSVMNDQTEMRPGKFGCLKIGLIASGILGILAVFGAWFIFSVTSPLNRANAIKTTLEWAMLEPIPEEATISHLEKRGSMFTREFVIEVEGEPKVIREWLAGSNGGQGLTPNSKGEFAIEHRPAGGGAQFAEIIVSPDYRKVRIRVYWS